jgi:hypothetical protein
MVFTSAKSLLRISCYPNPLTLILILYKEERDPKLLILLILGPEMVVFVISDDELPDIFN